MKPNIQGGVVDKYLNVYGTQNLKVAGRFRTVKSTNCRSLDLSRKRWSEYIQHGSCCRRKGSHNHRRGARA